MGTKVMSNNPKSLELKRKNQTFVQYKMLAKAGSTNCEIYSFAVAPNSGRRLGKQGHATGLRLLNKLF